jgi:hypothetical protein
MDNSPDLLYANLVKNRQAYNLGIEGLINPSNLFEGIYDELCFLDPWAKWHNNIPAETLLVGQDWGGQNYYLKNRGGDDNNNPTCKNLIELFKVINIDIGSPSKPNIQANTHFTNIIPFLRTGKMQGELNKILTQTVINEFANLFTKPLINIVKPKFIITLGMAALRGVAFIYNVHIDRNAKLKDFAGGKPLILKEDLLLFPMYHCGSSGVNRNRNLEQQKKDWINILQYA